MSSFSISHCANELQFAAAEEKLVKKQIRARANYITPHCSNLDQNTAFRVASCIPNAAVGQSKPVCDAESRVRELPPVFKAACERTSQPINEFFSHLHRGVFWVSGSFVKSNHILTQGGSEAVFCETLLAASKAVCCEEQQQVRRVAPRR